MQNILSLADPFSLFQITSNVIVILHSKVVILQGFKQLLKEGRYFRTMVIKVWPENHDELKQV